MGIMTDLSLKLSANTAQLTNGLNDAKKALGDFGKDAKTAAQKITDSFSGIGGATSNIKEMRNALRDLRGMSFAGKTKEEIQAINQEIGRLTDEMGDLKAIQKGMGTEFGTLMAKGLQAVAAMAEVGVGVASMFGLSEESANKYQQAMVRLIGITQGLGAIQDAFETKIFKYIVLRLRETAATVSQTVATWAQTAAQWALNASLLVIMATIGAVVVVVAAVAAGIYYLVKAFNANTDATEAQVKAYNDLADAHAKANEQDEFNLEILKALGKNQTEMLKAEIDFATAKRNRLSQDLDALALIGDKTEEQRKAFDEGSKEEVKLGDEIIIKKIQLGTAIKANTDKLKEQKVAVKENKDAWVEAYEKQQELEQYNVPQFIKGVTQPDTDMNSMKGKSNILPKQDKDFAESLKKRHALSMKFQAAEVSEAAKAAKQLQDIEDAKNESKLNALSNTFGLAKGIFAENTIAYKAMAIAQAGIDTYMAANVALASAPPPFNFILMGATIAAGLANVAKIAGFANGGVVGGNSYSGDKVPIMANSGEMILNGSQQGRLFAMINAQSMMGTNRGGQVEFVIKGDKLIGVLNNTGKKINKTR